MWGRVAPTQPRVSTYAVSTRVLPVRVAPTQSRVSAYAVRCGTASAVRCAPAAHCCNQQTIPPSRLRRATSLYTREALAVCRCAPHTLPRASAYAVSPLHRGQTRMGAHPPPSTQKHRKPLPQRLPVSSIHPQALANLLCTCWICCCCACCMGYQPCWDISL